MKEKGTGCPIQAWECYELLHSWHSPTVIKKNTSWLLVCWDKSLAEIAKNFCHQVASQSNDCAWSSLLCTQMKKESDAKITYTSNSSVSWVLHSRNPSDTWNLDFCSWCWCSTYWLWRKQSRPCFHAHPKSKQEKGEPKLLLIRHQFYFAICIYHSFVCVKEIGRMEKYIIMSASHKQHFPGKSLYTAFTITLAEFCIFKHK